MRYYCLQLIITLCTFNYFNANTFPNHKYLKSNCFGRLAETIPVGLTYDYSVNSSSTFDELLHLFSDAQQTIDIASFYWTLSASDEAPEPGDGSTLKGQQLLDALIDAKKSRDVKIRIAVDKDSNSTRVDDSHTRIASTDLHLLRPYADIRELDFAKLVGSGVLHTKFIVVDGVNFYLGSANMDWRSITHVKELGAVITNCGELTEDLMKIFEIYWYLGAENATVPDKWPDQYSASYNISNPLSLTINETVGYEVYLAVEPKSFCSTGRSEEIDSILSIINGAKQYVYISVMDYYPLYLYQRSIQFWPLIDDALKRAAIERRVQVRLLVSRWRSSRNYQSIYLKSLNALNSSRVIGGSVEAKLFFVPAFSEEQALIKFARVNHDKYMVTDTTLYIGTSNWAADYFTDTAGVAIIMTANNTASNQTSNLKTQVLSIFNRDWYSSYAHNLEYFDESDSNSSNLKFVSITVNSIIIAYPLIKILFNFMN